jgi:hypothetical protein
VVTQLVDTLRAWWKHRAAAPWASFEVVGFDDGGQIRVEFDWNDAFINKIKALGFQAETDEDCVQLFFYASSMKPTSLNANDVQQPQETWDDVI